MATARFLLLLALLIAAHACHCQVSVAAEVVAVSTEKGLPSRNALALALAAADDSYKIQGRKMLVPGNNVKRLGVDRVQELGKEEVVKVGRSSTTPSVRGGGHHHHHHYVSKEINDASFVAFTADYGAPRHHPPKNN